MFKGVREKPPHSCTVFRSADTERLIAVDYLDQIFQRGCSAEFPLCQSIQCLRLHGLADFPIDSVDKGGGIAAFVGGKPEPHRHLLLNTALSFENGKALAYCTIAHGGKALSTVSIGDILNVLINSHQEFTPLCRIIQAGQVVQNSVQSFQPGALAHCGIGVWCRAIEHNRPCICQSIGDKDD